MTAEKYRRRNAASAVGITNGNSLDIIMLLGFTQACSSCLLIDELITKHAAALNLDEAEQHDDAVAAYADEGQAPADQQRVMAWLHDHGIIDEETYHVLAAIPPVSATYATCTNRWNGS
ncbi:TPA: hypothetical protein ACH3X2_011723 [Trebouxia sp. C0005]